jgi:hypothetical protein
MKLSWEDLSKQHVEENQEPDGLELLLAGSPKTFWLASKEVAFIVNGDKHVGGS